MPDDTDTAVSRGILDAALEELVEAGIDGFGIDGVARRAGVSRAVILRGWHDRRVLLMAAQLHRARETFPTPDTGSLRGDLLAYAASQIEATKAPDTRLWLHRMLPSGRDADLSDVRMDFWDCRLNAVATILRRAADRGELRPGIDPLLATKMYVGSSLFEPIFYETAASPEYAEQMLDVFIRGISA